MQSLRCLLATAALVATASAQSALLPDIPNTVGGSASSWPWYLQNNPTAWPSARIQIIYDSDLFTSNMLNSAPVTRPITITSIDWRGRNWATARSWSGGTYNNCVVRVGAAGVDYTGIGPNYAANYRGGVVPQPAYIGAVSIPAGNDPGGGVGPFFVTVTLTNPITYDPTTGEDLIIEVACDGSWTPNVPTDARAVQSNAIDGLSIGTQPLYARMGRVANTSNWQALDGDVTTNYGTVARINYTTTPLQASFSSDKSRAGPTEIVTFTDYSVTDDPNGIQTWAWDFDGNGTTDSTLQNPTWVYGANCGLKNVRLTVTDTINPPDSETKNGFIDVGVVADFSAPDTPAPAIIQFTDTSLGIPDSWAWDFDGDMVIDATDQNPMFPFVFNYRYDVTLTVTNSVCGTDTVTKPVDTRQKLCTIYQNDVNYTQGGATYFDVNVLNPAGIAVTALDVHTDRAGETIGLTVRTSSSMTFDGNAAAWTQVATGTGISAGGNRPTHIDITDFCLHPGVTGIMVEYTTMTNGARQLYTIGDMAVGPGSNTYYANADLEIQNGIGRSVAFAGNRTTPRIWNGCIYYNHGASAGSMTQIGAGCINSTGNVATFGGQGGAVPTIGQTITFEITNAPANQALSFVMIGFLNYGGIDLGLIGMPGCLLYPEPLIGLNAPTNGSGVGIANLSIPSDANSIGLSFFGQGIIADPGFNLFNAVLSNAVNGVAGCP